MTDVVSRSVISLEIDDSSVDFDLANAQAVLLDFIARMQTAAHITPRVDMEELARSGRQIIRLDVDPNTTRAGMEVIQGIVREYTARLNREAHVTVGVDTQQVRTMATRLKGALNYVAQGIGQGVGQAIAFTVSRGIEKVLWGAIKAPVDTVIASLAAYRVQEKAEAALAKAIGNTGAQAGKSSDELIKYAKQLEQLTNTSDQTILGLQKVLLSSEGLTGSNFDRATKAALDLAEVLGGDATNKAEKLAKALQEPTKALEMLRDEGISFTDSQKDIVKLFVEVGDLASAQGIILDELESRYGGAADRTATFSDRLDEAGIRFETLKERMGEAIAENDTSFIPAIEASIDALEQLAPVGIAAATVLAELATAMLDYAISADSANLSTDEMKNKIDEWVVGIKSAVGSFDNFLVSITRGHLAVAKFAADMKGDAFDGGLFAEQLGQAIEGVDSVINAEAEKVATALAAKRKRRKEQAELDAKQRIEEFNRAKADREKELALGSGLVTQDEIDKKGAKQAIADAKAKKIQDAKDLKHKLAAEAKALADKEKAEKKATEAEKTALEKAAREEHKRIVAENAAYDKKMAEEERALAKQNADYEKALGKDSIAGLHDRIQDALFMRRDQANKEKATAGAITSQELNAVDKANKEKEKKGKGKKPVFAPEDKPMLAADSIKVKVDIPELRRNVALTSAKNPTEAAAAKPHVTGQRATFSDENGNQVPATDKGGKIEVKVEPKQDEVVKAITMQTTAMVKALGKPGKLGA